MSWVLHFEGIRYSPKSYTTHFIPEVIVFDFVYLDIEYRMDNESSTGHCSFDYLAIYDGENNNTQILQKYCAALQYGNVIKH